MDAQQLEVEDCAYPLLKEIIHSTDPEVSFKDADVAIFVGGFPRKAGMERKDLLNINIGIFKKQGEALAKVAKKSCKVIVIANPANTNCLALRSVCQDFPAENFTALTRLDQNRAKAQIATKEGVHHTTIKDVIIWGNHSSTQFPDVSQVKINGEEFKDAASDFYTNEVDFTKTVQTRGAAVIKARGVSSAMSAARATRDHIRDWYLGNSEEIVSMGIIPSKGTYGIEDELVFSLPLRCKGNWEYEVVEGIALSEAGQKRFDVTLAELKEEKEMGSL